MIKICGIKDARLAVEAVRLGANYIGIMQYKASKRYVDLETAEEIATAVKNAGATPVAIFVDSNANEMLEICKKTKISTVQLHGTIARESHYRLPAHFSRLYVVHVGDNGRVSLDSDTGIGHINADRDILLFDRVGGGTGKSFNWKNFTNPYCMPFLLAGGLNPQNVKEAIQQLHPIGVDVSSGVENASGVKDKRLISEFIKASREAFAEKVYE